jgi:hypothetical protein
VLYASPGASTASVQQLVWCYVDGIFSIMNDAELAAAGLLMLAADLHSPQALFQLMFRNLLVEQAVGQVSIANASVTRLRQTFSCSCKHCSCAQVCSPSEPFADVVCTV